MTERTPGSSRPASPALAVSAPVVGVSPFSADGVLVPAAAPDVDRERFFRRPMVYGEIVVAGVPAAARPVMVLPGWGWPRPAGPTATTGISRQQQATVKEM